MNTLCDFSIQSLELLQSELKPCAQGTYAKSSALLETNVDIIILFAIKTIYYKIVNTKCTIWGHLILNYKV